jgi:hypothetical protein
MIKVYWILGLLLLSFSAFYILKNFVRLFNRYVFDGADSRVPYIIGLFIFNLILQTEVYYFLFTGYISPLFVFQVKIYSFIWISYLFRSRLSGYVTMNLSKEVKNNVYIAFSVVQWIMLFLIFLNFDPTIIDSSHKAGFLSQVHLGRFLSIFSVNYIGKLQIPFFIFSIIAPGFLFWFDLSERRYKYIKLNALFYIPVLSTTLILLNCQVEWLLTLLFIVYLFFPTFILEKEIKSIIRHSTKIDTRINQINKIINSIVKICPQCPGHCVIRNENCKMNTKQRFQIKLIARMIIDDPALEDIVMKKHFFNHKKYANIYEKINFAIVEEKQRIETLKSSIQH